jgi:hypothetical protein
MAESNPIEGIFDSDVITEEQMKSMFAPKFGVIKPNPKKPLDPEIVKQLKAWVLKQQSFGEGEIMGEDIRKQMLSERTKDKGGIPSPSPLQPLVKPGQNTFGMNAPEYEDPNHPIDEDALRNKYIEMWKEAQDLLQPIPKEVRTKVKEKFLEKTSRELNEKYNVNQLRDLHKIVVGEDMSKILNDIFKKHNIPEEEQRHLYTDTIIRKTFDPPAQYAEAKKA